MTLDLNTDGLSLQHMDPVGGRGKEAAETGGVFLFRAPKVPRKDPSIGNDKPGDHDGGQQTPHGLNNPIIDTAEGS